MGRLFQINLLITLSGDGEILCKNKTVFGQAFSLSTTVDIHHFQELVCGSGVNVSLLTQELMTGIKGLDKLVLEVCVFSFRLLSVYI